LSVRRERALQVTPMTGGTGQPVLTDDRPPAALISSARNATPLRPLVAQGRASSLDTATDCPTFTFGFSPAVVTVMTSPPSSSRTNTCVDHIGRPVPRSTF